MRRSEVHGECVAPPALRARFVGQFVRLATVQRYGTGSRLRLRASIDRGSAMEIRRTVVWRRDDHGIGVNFDEGGADLAAKVSGMNRVSPLLR